MNSISKQPPQTPSNPQRDFNPFRNSMNPASYQSQNSTFPPQAPLNPQCNFNPFRNSMNLASYQSQSSTCPPGFNPFEIRYLLREEILLKVKRLYVQKLRDRELLRFQVYLKLWNLLWACLKKNFSYARQLPKPSLQTSLPHIFTLLSADMKMQ